MKIDKEKLHKIAVEENEEEKAFSSDLAENKELYKASTRIAMKIKRALKQVGMTQSDLAVKMGIDPAIISRNLSGKANLELKTLVKFEEVLGIRIIDRSISPYSSYSNERRNQQYIFIVDYNSVTSVNPNFFVMNPLKVKKKPNYKSDVEYHNATQMEAFI